MKQSIAARPSGILCDLGGTLMAIPPLPETLRGMERASIHRELALSGAQLERLGHIIQHVIAVHALKTKNRQLDWITAWQYALQEMRLPHDSKFARSLNELHLQAMHNLAKPYSYTIKLLELVRETGIPICLISNVTGPPEIFDDLLREHGIFELLESRVWSSAICFRKPHLAIFQKALNDIGASASDSVIMIGDDETADIHAANALGLTSVYVTHNTEYTPSSQASYIVSDDNILHLFRKLCSKGTVGEILF
jgi:HAD superfamily hydrolase (TIGR01549 family)